MTLDILKKLQLSLGYEFKNIEYLKLALTHSSWAYEHRREDGHNERLEYLGDAALELCVSTVLFEMFPKAREGLLTSMRARLVGETSLAAIAREFGVENCIRLGAGEDKQGGRNKNSVLSDAVEAIIAAAYLDGGFDAAKNVVNCLFVNRWPDATFKEPAPNNKTLLQEVCQKLFHKLPEYRLLESSGPDHERTFKVRLALPDGSEFLAAGSSCKKAEQACAGMALEAMQNKLQ